MRSSRPSRVLALLAAASLAVVGCGGSDVEPAASEVTTGVVSSVSGDADETGSEADDGVGSEAAESGTPEEEASTGEAGDEGAAEPSDGSCLIGEWQIEEAQLDGYYSQLEMGAAQGVSFDIVGGSGLSFTADGAYQYTPNFGFEMDADGIVAEGAVTGTTGGTYTVEDGVVITTITDDSLDVSVEVAGITMTASELGIDLATFAPVSSAPVDCSGENPVVMFDLGNGSRQPVELTPA